MNACDDFVERARAVTPFDAVSGGLVDIGLKRVGTEMVGPCPIGGGQDGFAVHTTRALWNCRKCGQGGHDAIGLIAHIECIDLKSRTGFIAACEAVLGETAPNLNISESEADKANREAKAKALKEQAEERRKQKEHEANSYREKERERARSILDRASDLTLGHLTYFEKRGIGDVNLKSIGHFRSYLNFDYWHDGHKIHSGPAIVAPFMDWTGTIGCHITWIDLDNPPKYRPHLHDKDGNALPTKKMRGSKMGGLIPLIGRGASCKRWVIGEGIENVIAVAMCEGQREDTFYAAAGDLGNLAGPADPKSRFKHPAIKRADKNRAMRPTYVPGSKPLDCSDDRAIPVAPHVKTLILLGDADSETVFTKAAMDRAYARFSMAGRVVAVVWPAKGYADFADWVAGGMEMLK